MIPDMIRPSMRRPRESDCCARTHRYRCCLCRAMRWFPPQTKWQDDGAQSPKSAWKVSPALASIGRMNEPDRIISPASSVHPMGRSRLASQATPLAGWLSTPAATPVSSISAVQIDRASRSSACRHRAAGTAGRRRRSRHWRRCPRWCRARSVRALVSASTRSDARIEDFQRRHDVGGRIEHVVDGAVGPESPG